MTRPLRIEFAGAVYHVTSRGNERRRIFEDDKDRVVLLETLKKVNDRYHWICHAYCLMDNHYHLIIETPDGNLSKGMRQVNGVYTMHFNRRHDGAGHIFQGRYKAILLQRENHLLEVCRYVALNPVRAKIVANPEEWEWSSYRSTAGLEKSHPCLTRRWVLEQFGGKKREAEERYRAFVIDGIGQKSIWSGVKGQSILGNEDFVNRLSAYLNKYRGEKDIPRSQRYVSRPSLREIFRNSRRQGRKRNRTILDAVKRWGYNQREVANYLGFHYSTVSRLIKRVNGS